MSYTLTKEQIEKHNGKVVASSGPVLLFDQIALISGEVPRQTPYEKGFQGEYKFKDMQWQSASDVIDERCLIFSLKGKGICVITGCGHTGIVNAAQHAITLLKSSKVHFIMGGVHLAGSEYAARINPTLIDLERINPDFIITGHCTGRQTQARLSDVFDRRHVPYGVGAYLKF